MPSEEKDITADPISPGRLIQRRSKNDVIFYASPLLEHHGIRHAFSTRIGGVSEPPFNAMNLGNPNGCAGSGSDRSHTRKLSQTDAGNRM